MAKKSNDQALGTIKGVDPTKDFHESTGSKWLPIFKAFNPLGAVADAYAKTLGYKIEAKRLEIELTRIKEQAKIIKGVVDMTFELKMEELQQRRIALIGFYETVNVQLQRIHIERVKVLEMARLAQQKAFEPGLSIEERKLYKEMSIEMTRELPHFGDRANESLQKLVQALPPVEISQNLLER